MPNSLIDMNILSLRIEGTYVSPGINWEKIEGRDDIWVREVDVQMETWLENVKEILEKVNINILDNANLIVFLNLSDLSLDSTIDFEVPFIQLMADYRMRLEIWH